MRTWRDFETRLGDEVLVGNLTLANRDVLLALASYIRNGNPCPSHKELAHRGGVCTKTVQRSLDHAARLGLVAWCERMSTGHRRWQLSNRYTILRPRGPVLAGRRIRRPHRVGPRGPAKKGTTPLFLPSCTREAPSFGDVVAAQAALARYRARFEAQRRIEQGRDRCFT